MKTSLLRTGILVELLIGHVRLINLMNVMLRPENVGVNLGLLKLTKFVTK